MGTAKPLPVSEVLRTAIDQYADPMAFVRELVQNAIDAGALAVDVEVDGAETDHLLEVRVRDDGAGMSRRTIENRLTRMFVSSGDEDPSRIGWFGIGFWSVFALSPLAVIVDTHGPDGAWRVVFESPESYTLRQLDRPRPGTCVSIVLRRQGPHHLRELRGRVAEALATWCSYAGTELRFDGEAITKPFAFDTPVSVLGTDAHTQILAGHPMHGAGYLGLYREGLTLLHDEPLHEGVTVSISSSRIHHTLKRDRMLHDQAYGSILQLADRVVRRRLCEEVFSALESHVWHPPNDPDDHEQVAKWEADRAYLYRAATWHVRRGHDRLTGADERAAFRSPAGLAIGISACRRAVARRGVIYYAHARSHLTDALEDQGHLVLKLAADSPEHTLLAALDDRAQLVSVHLQLCMPKPITDREYRQQTRRLEMAIAQLIIDNGGELTTVQVGYFDYPGSAISGEIFLIQPHFGDISRKSEALGRSDELFECTQTMVLNADHRGMHALIHLAQTEPEYAAYQALKLMLLGSRPAPRLSPERDAALAQMAVTRRWNRINR